MRGFRRQGRLSPRPSSWRVEPTGYRATDFVDRARCLGRDLSLGGRSADRRRDRSRRGRRRLHAAGCKAYDVIASFPHMPAEIDGSQMQDAVPTLAVLAAFNETPVRFVGIANLRVKECDRIRALSTGLSQIRAGASAARRATTCSSQSDPSACRPDAAGRDRHLRRSPHRHELRAGRPEDRRHHHSRSGLRRQDLPGLLAMTLAGLA
jgi:hypothetical protein